MNKNFKKFLEESYSQGFKICAEKGHRIGDLDAIFNSIVMGTFGELIVRECAERSRELGQPELGQGLMKHFGVEE